MYSGSTHLSVRESIQPVALHRVQASNQLTSGETISPVFDTKKFKEVFIMTDISQVSGTTTTLDIQTQTSPDNSNWFNLGILTQRTAAGQHYELVSGYVSEYTRFDMDVVSSGGCWTQIDANFVR